MNDEVSPLCVTYYLSEDSEVGRALDCPEWFHGGLAFEMDSEGWVGLVLRTSRQRPPGELWT